LGVTASLQPSHTGCTRDDGSDEWSRRLGGDRAARGWRLRDLREAGATVALGSDRPIAPYDVRAVPATARRPRAPGRAGRAWHRCRRWRAAPATRPRPPASRPSGALSRRASVRTSPRCPWTRCTLPATN
jgi:hypothetical protein